MMAGGRRIGTRTLTRRSQPMTIENVMTDHAFLAAMLALIGLQVLVLGLVLGYFTYRIWRTIERMEGVGAAAFLEVRKVLGQSR
jgi:hypothetical protein